MSTPLCSVIVPTFNRGLFLTRCLESILASGLSDFEIVVVDDGSTDDTRERIAPLPGPIRYLRQDNQGQCAARNAGLRLAQGEFVAFLDSDDTFLPGVHERMVQFLVLHPAVDLIFGDVFVNLPDLSRFRGHEACRFEEFRAIAGTDAGGGIRILDRAAFLRYQILRQNTVLLQAAVVRRALIDRAGAFDPALTGLEEWEFFTRLAAFAEVAYLDEACCDICKHDGNLSRDVEAMAANGVQIRRRFLNATLPVPAAVVAELRPTHRRHHLAWALNAFQRNDLLEARQRLHGFLVEQGPDLRAGAYWGATWLPRRVVGGLRTLKHRMRGDRE